MSRYRWLLILLLLSLACNLTFKDTPTAPPPTLIPITTLYIGTKTCAQIFPSAQQGRTHIVQSGENLSTLDGLKIELGPHFRLVQGPLEVPFVIRETRRKFQHTISEVTVWEKVR